MSCDFFFRGTLLMTWDLCIFLFFSLCRWHGSLRFLGMSENSRVICRYYIYDLCWEVTNKTSQWLSQEMRQEMVEMQPICGICAGLEPWKRPRNCHTLNIFGKSYGFPNRNCWYPKWKAFSIIFQYFGNSLESVLGLVTSILKLVWVKIGYPPSHMASWTISHLVRWCSQRTEPPYSGMSYLAVFDYRRVTPDIPIIVPIDIVKSPINLRRMAKPIMSFW